MKRFLSFAAVAVCAAFLAPAGAWAQCYAGVQGGFGVMSTELTAGAADIDGLGSRGLLAGVRAGCDVHANGNPFFAGAWAEYNWSNEQFSVNGSAFTATIKDQWGGSVRAGYAMQNGAKLYGFIGADRADSSWSATGGGALPTAPSFNGWHGGVGIEIPLAKSIDLSVEPRFTEFSKTSIGNTGLSLQPREASAVVALTFHAPATMVGKDGYVPVK